MTYNQFEEVLSVSRLTKYSTACLKNKRKTLQLYRANIRLSQKLYAVIGIFEVALRNAIDRHFLAIKGQDWLTNAAEDGVGYLDSTGCENSFHNVHEAINRLGQAYTHDALIASLTFGFWTYQFSKFEFPASGNTLLSIFKNRPFRTKQKDIFKHLMQINILRNRIAHHEPICFDAKYCTISTAMVTKRYDLMRDLIFWLGHNPTELLFGVDNVMKEIQSVNRL